MMNKFVAVAIFAAAFTVLAVAFAFADPVAVVPAVAPSWWQSFWAEVQAPLVALVMAVFSAIGMIVSTEVKKYFGARASEAANNVYQLMVDQAAGWLMGYLHLAAAPTPGSAIPVSALNTAVAYAKKAYPDIVSKIDPSDNELGRDIVAALGKMLAKSGTSVSGPVGGLLGGLFKAVM